MAKTPEEVWENIATPQKRTNIIRFTVKLAISLFPDSPREAGRLLSGTDKRTADSIAYMASGVPDGDTVCQVGKKLRE